MTVETFTYVTSLTAANPGASDPKSEGDDHLRGIKTVLLNSFPNVAGAVSATHTQLGYVTGVTSAIQTQLDAKAPLASPTLTGTPLAPTAIAGTNTTQIATTAFVGAAVTAGTTSALTLIQAQTASSSATIDFTASIDSTYEEYEIHVLNAIPASANRNIQLLVSPNAGVSWDNSAGNYSFGYTRSTFSEVSTTSGTAIDIGGVTGTSGVEETVANGGLSMVVRVINPSGTAAHKMLTFIGAYPKDTTPTIVAFQGAGVRLATAAITGVRIQFDSGNIASGKFKLYGVKK